MLTKPQLSLIHTAKSKLKLNDSDYRNMLSAFNVSSSKDLSYSQFLALLDAFKKLGFQQLPRPESLADSKVREVNGISLATKKQIGKIMAVWFNSPAVENKNVPALRAFVKRIAGVDSLDWLPMSDVQKILKAIQHLSPLHHSPAGDPSGSDALSIPVCDAVGADLPF